MTIRDIKADTVYEGPTGPHRTVDRIVGNAVIYYMGSETRPRMCAIWSFAAWAQREVKP